MNPGIPPEERNVTSMQTKKHPQTPWGKNPHIQYLFSMKTGEKQGAREYTVIINGKNGTISDTSPRTHEPTNSSKNVTFSSQGSFVMNVSTHSIPT